MAAQPEMTIVAAEMDRFNRLGATFWNSAGPMRPLHVINGLRCVLDIGCGAVLLSDAVAEASPARISLSQR